MTKTIRFVKYSKVISRFVKGQERSDRRRGGRIAGGVTRKEGYPEAGSLLKNRRESRRERLAERLYSSSGSVSPSMAVVDGSDSGKGSAMVIRSA